MEFNKIIETKSLTYLYYICITVSLPVDLHTPVTLKNYFSHVTNNDTHHWQIQGGARDTPLHLRVEIRSFLCIFFKILQNNRLAHPGSATAHFFIFVTEQCKYMGTYYPIDQEVSILLGPPVPPNSQCKTKFTETCYVDFGNCDSWFRQYYGPRG